MSVGLCLSLMHSKVGDFHTAQIAVYFEERELGVFKQFCIDYFPISQLLSHLLYDS